MKVYKKFEEIWEDYPNMCAVHIETEYGDALRLGITENIGSFGTKVWGIEWTKDRWNELHITNDNMWFYNIFRQSKLKGISLYISKSISANIYKKISFSKLENLEKLRFVKNTSEDYSLQIPALPALNTLILSGWSSVDWVGKLDSLWYLHAGRQNTLALPALLEQLNPSKLTQMYLESIKNLQFYTNIEIPKKKSKKASVLPPFEGFEEFKNITHLGLYNNKIAVLPFALTTFPNLAWADLSSNKLSPFPYEYLYLPTLHKIEVATTSIVKNKNVKGGSELIKLKKDFEKKNISLEDRKTLFQILVEDEAVGKELTLFELLRLSTLTTHSGILRKIASICEQKQTENPFENVPDIAHIAVVGKAPAMPFESIKDFFKTYNIHITNKITDKTQIVCVGEKPLPTQTERLINSNLPTALPTQLKAYMAKLETPYLAVSEIDVVKNLETLLLSEDEHNVVLALQMMKNGGLPDLFFEFLCLQYIRNEWDCKKELTTILEKYATPAQFIILKKSSSIKYRSKNYLKDFINSSEFDKEKIIASALKFYTHHKSSKYKDYFLYLLKAAIWQAEGKALELVLDRYLQSDGTLILENTSMNISNIPSTLKGNPRIKKIIILEWLIKQNTKNIVNSLPNLTEIEILFQMRLRDEEVNEIDIIEEKVRNYEAIFTHKKISVTPYSGNLDNY